MQKVGSSMHGGLPGRGRDRRFGGWQGARKSAGKVVRVGGVERLGAVVGRRSSVGCSDVRLVGWASGRVFGLSRIRTFEPAGCRGCDSDCQWAILGQFGTPIISGHPIQCGTPEISVLDSFGQFWTPINLGRALTNEISDTHVSSGERGWKSGCPESRPHKMGVQDLC